MDVSRITANITVELFYFMYYTEIQACKSQNKTSKNAYQYF